jgi:hypothetical protein
MVGEDGEWPSSGEIDIMECYQDKLLANVAHGTAQRRNARWHGKSISTEALDGEVDLEKLPIEFIIEYVRVYQRDEDKDMTTASLTIQTSKG